MLNRGRRHFITQLTALTLATGFLFPGRARSVSGARVAIDRATSKVPVGADCTTLIQSAIDCLPASGGEITIGPGEYMIDAVRSLSLRSNVSLSLAQGAIFRALPNAAGSYAIMRIQGASNVRVSGGAIIGDLDEHKASVGEWGMGIDVRNSHGVTLENIHVSKCWGDGIYVGSTSKDDKGACSDLTLRGIVAQANRRQGVSIVACQGAIVDGCSFLDTAGTAPAAGIDLEPNAGQSVQRVKIVNCIAQGNQGTGFQFYAKEMGARIVDCSIDGGSTRSNGAYGVHFAGTSNCQLRGSEITDNGDFGIFVEKTARDCTLDPVLLSTNLRRPKRQIAMLVRAMGAPRTEAMIEDGATNVTIHIDGPQRQ